MKANFYIGNVIRTAEEVADRGHRLAQALYESGMREGHVLALLMPNSHVYADVVVACQVAGFYYCPINWHLTGEEIAHQLNDCQASVIIADQERHNKVDLSAHSGLQLILADTVKSSATDGLLYEDWLLSHSTYTGPAASPRAQLVYTSGTTGKPKGIKRYAVPLSEISESQQRVDALVQACYGVSDKARVLIPAPLYHSGPGLVFRHALRRAERCVVMERFDAEEVLALIEHHGINVLYTVPTMYVRLLRLDEDKRTKYDISALKFVASTGAPCAPEIKQKMIDWMGPIFWETYATSETGAVTLASSVEALKKPGTAGRCTVGAEVAVYRNDGTHCDPFEHGLIYMRQHYMADFTYVGLPEARQEIERDGLVTMGDIGYFDDDDYLFVCDRITDMVISGGVNIYPVEIENALQAFPEILDVAVIGVPDAEMGEKLVAVIKARFSRISVDEIYSWLDGRIARHKIPREVMMVNNFARDENGKILKRYMRDQYQKLESVRV